MRPQICVPNCRYSGEKKKKMLVEVEEVEKVVEEKVEEEEK
jgi:hypothetical protein